MWGDESRRLARLGPTITKKGINKGYTKVAMDYNNAVDEINVLRRFTCPQLYFKPSLQSIFNLLKTAVDAQKGASVELKLRITPTKQGMTIKFSKDKETVVPSIHMTFGR